MTMTKVKQLVLVLAFFLAAGLPARAGTLTVTDFSGRTLTLDCPARRVVCLIESALSGIYMLGAQDQVAGVSAQVYQEGIFKYYAAMDRRIAEREIPSPGSWDHVNLESLVSLSPDLVIIWANQTEAIEAIAGKGIPVYGVSLSSIEDVLKEIGDLGQLLGKNDRAAVLRGFARQELDRFALAEKKFRHRPEVYFIWSQGLLETSGSPSTVDDMITLAGGRNVCGHIPLEHTVINQETLISLKPDIMILWPNSRLSPEDITGHPIWRNLPASKNKQVFELPSPFFCDLWTLKCFYVIDRIQSVCQPAASGPFDEKREKRQLMTVLYGPELGQRIPVE
ncbi:ABC transporter substrate-binding protein [Desulfospira joergensenii]|uniref:ABC transporter substrate-binding protein n=1 Tax=Desulfospira joergensenii TaxID=53329 RepID=UPI0003B447F1|nr:ABC transporter substrate-binding protein [Desulfospira joergensenii]